MHKYCTSIAQVLCTSSSLIHLFCVSILIVKDNFSIKQARKAQRCDSNLQSETINHSLTVSIRKNPIFVLLIFRPFLPKIGHVSSDFEETCLTGYCLFYALRACFNNHFPTLSLRPLERLLKVHFEIILIKSLLFRNSALGSKLFAIIFKSN